MEVSFNEKYSQDTIPDNFVIRHHIWPGHVIVSFMAQVCGCGNRLDNGFGYCSHCSGAIPTTKEKEIYKVK